MPKDSDEEAEPGADSDVDFGEDVQLPGPATE